MSTPRTSARLGRLSHLLAVSAATLVLAACEVDPATAPPTPATDVASASAERVGDAGRVTRYNILDWVLAQGSYCARPENRGGPVCGPDFPGLSISGWSDPANGFCGFVDYAGFATRYLEQAGGPSLGTTYDGSITERLLNDGRAEVTITLRTENALAFVQPCEGFPASPILFGALPADILAGATPAVGSSFFSITYLAPPGYPFPEPVQLFIAEPPYELVKIAFHGDATGPFQAASGFGEGTLGRLRIQQVGRVTPGLLNREGDYPGDFFPVENVTLRPIGR
jgi:hypothetical protein